MLKQDCAVLMYPGIVHRTTGTAIVRELEHLRKRNKRFNIIAAMISFIVVAFALWLLFHWRARSVYAPKRLLLEAHHKISRQIMQPIKLT